MQYELQVLRGREGVRALTLEAVSENDAATQARQNGYTVVSVRARNAVGALFQRWSRFPLLQFSQELLALLKAGLSVVEALEALAEKEADAGTRRVLEQTLRQLREGKSFSAALRATPSVFPPLFTSAIEASEKTSDLSTALARYVAYQQQVESVRKKMANAMIYPVLLLPALRARLQDAVAAIRQGQSISQAMEVHGLSTPVAARMLRVGERTGDMGGMHSFNEWYQPQLAYVGPQATFLTVLGLVGIEGISAPILPRRPPRD